MADPVTARVRALVDGALDRVFDEPFDVRTAQELEDVREAARALGADITLPGVSSADAAESMVELAKAGLDVQDSIDGARGVLQLATVAAIENAQAVELTANALNASSNAATRRTAPRSAGWATTTPRWCGSHAKPWPTASR